ncbi:MAG: hypothetical protein L0H64_18465, partial [Pseudonocardia sp.]|nr:hypothetical protein [Pseudonocardia sp.]
AVTRGGDLTPGPLAPDRGGALRRRGVESAPAGGHRGALEVCALASVTTEALLRAVLGRADVHEEFGWLRGLSFVEAGPDGLFPHDLGRDVLDADLRWRDPDGYARVFAGERGVCSGPDLVDQVER